MLPHDLLTSKSDDPRLYGTQYSRTIHKALYRHDFSFKKYETGYIHMALYTQAYKAIRINISHIDSIDLF